MGVIGAACNAHSGGGGSRGGNKNFHRFKNGQLNDRGVLLQQLNTGRHRAPRFTKEDEDAIATARDAIENKMFDE